MSSGSGSCSSSHSGSNCDSEQDEACEEARHWQAKHGDDCSKQDDHGSDGKYKQGSLVSSGKHNGDDNRKDTNAESDNRSWHSYAHAT